MSTGRSNALDALPRASIFNYFRPPHSRLCVPRRSSRYYQRPPPPPYTRHQQHHAAHATLLPRIAESPEADVDTANSSFNIDEEAECGFWGDGPKPFSGDNEVEYEESDGREERGYAFTWHDVLGLLPYGLLILIAVLNLDMLLSHAGLETGMVKWGMPLHGAVESTVSTSQQVRQDPICRPPWLIKLIFALGPFLQISD